MSNNNAYMAEYMLRRYHERRTWAIERQGGKCANCGTTEHLELDHINPKDKKASIGKIWSYSWKRFVEEVDKCQILCHDCHLKKTAKDVMPPHGTHWRYRKHLCRCDPCETAFRKTERETQRRYREKKKSLGL